jgi:hypothetical protein
MSTRFAAGPPTDDLFVERSEDSVRRDKANERDEIALCGLSN